MLKAIISYFGVWILTIAYHDTLQPHVTAFVIIREMDMCQATDMTFYDIATLKNLVVSWSSTVKQAYYLNDSVLLCKHGPAGSRLKTSALLKAKQIEQLDSAVRFFSRITNALLTHDSISRRPIN
jgi:hypothetical protein